MDMMLYVDGLIERCSSRAPCGTASEWMSTCICWLNALRWLEKV